MFGDRLKLARKKAGYSLRHLSNALGGSPTAQAIGKYERGEMMPNSSILIQLARTLDISPEFLLSERVEKLEVPEFRKLSGTSAKDRARVEAVVIDSLQRYLAIEDILELGNSSWSTRPSGNRFIGLYEDGESLAQDVRREWKLGIDPILNMTALLEDRGIKVFAIPLPERVSGLTCLVRRPNRKAMVPAIVVNRRMTLERRRFTLAHELAHRLIDKSSPVDHEKASNAFAGAFLMHRDHLVREVGENRRALGYQELVQLKRMYRVSAAALLVRLQQVGIIDESTLTYAFKTFAKGWRKSEPEPLEVSGKEGTYELPRRFERLCYWALAEKFIDLGKACELLQRPFTDVERGLKGPAEGNANGGL